MTLCFPGQHGVSCSKSKAFCTYPSVYLHLGGKALAAISWEGNDTQIPLTIPWQKATEHYFFTLRITYLLDLSLLVALVLWLQNQHQGFIWHRVRFTMVGLGSNSKSSNLPFILLTLLPSWPRPMLCWTWSYQNSLPALHVFLLQENKCGIWCLTIFIFYFSLTRDPLLMNWETEKSWSVSATMWK